MAMSMQMRAAHEAAILNQLERAETALSYCAQNELDDDRKEYFRAILELLRLQIRDVRKNEMMINDK